MRTDSVLFRNPDLYEKIVTIYGASNRYYHNIDHINHMLSNFDLFLKESDSVDLPPLNLDAIEYAILFHDIIYSVEPSHELSNEQSSAAYFYMYISNKMNMSSSTVLKCMDAIYATEFHLSYLHSIADETKILLDLDLAGFGESYSYVSKNAINIRKEYEHSSKWGSKQDFFIKRIEFLKKILNKDRIFYTDYFHDRLEKVAKDNIELSIEETISYLD